MRIVLGLEYDGSATCGWQSQADGCGVQDVVERALSTFADQPQKVVCAGRTDSGVHAWAQVVHLDTDLERPEQAWIRGTNSHLPRTVRVLWARLLRDAFGEEFHARFSARSRRYRYLLLNDAVAPAVLAGRMGWFHAPLDLALMRDAAAALLGEHDFSAFRAAECQAKTPVRTVTALDIDRVGSVIAITIQANAFLHHMVRNIVGALVAVGAGRMSSAEFQRVFAARDRTLAPPTFSADGLYLIAIEYDAKFGLPEFRDRGAMWMPVTS